MSNRLFCCPDQRPLPTRRQNLLASLLLLGCALVCVPWARATSNNAPDWMHAQVNAPLPPHDEKTSAVLLYSEKRVDVISADKIKIRVREVYKILRPAGRNRGIVKARFNLPSKVTSMHGWCIPTQGKDYTVEDKEAVEVSLDEIEGSDLINDVKMKLLRIPAADPGNFVGFEYEIEENPLLLQDIWAFQQEDPAREEHFFLCLPLGWEYKASWINYPEAQPTRFGDNEWEWVIQNVKGVREEKEMPPFYGVVGHMIISFFPSSGHAPGAFANWKEMGDWYLNLARGRRDPSPEIKQKVAALTASAPAPLDKMKAIASFVQSDVRYVSIQLGIGGFQPHPANDIFNHRYGDCKDKATLMSSMLHEIGVESYYVLINTERGSVTPETPAYAAFDHVVLAIRLPAGISSSSLVATMQHPTLGRLLFFDPTSELNPFGSIGGYLQSNFGLLVTSDGGELVLLPQMPATTSGIRRSAIFTLSASGILQGDVEEFRFGDRARAQRYVLRSVTQDKDKIKPIESLLAGSLSSFQIQKASVLNFQQNDLPFGYRYSFTAENYAKHVGDLLAVRPRVLGTKSSALLEIKEPRIFPVEFSGPEKDTDTFEITLPPGYEVDDLPAPVDADFGFASYHSKSEVRGNVIHYTRTFEIKELSVPASRAEELKRFYRIIASDERDTAVLRTASR